MNKLYTKLKLFYLGFLTIFLIFSCNSFAGTTGKIAGKIIDATTNETLIGVNVIIVGTTMGAATDINGEYYILNIPPGTYEVKASLIGYQS